MQCICVVQHNTVWQKCDRMYIKITTAKYYYTTILHYIIITVITLLYNLNYVQATAQESAHNVALFLRATLVELKCIYTLSHLLYIKIDLFILF